MPDLLTGPAQRWRLGALAAGQEAEARAFAVRVGHLVELHELAVLEGGVGGVEQFVELELAGTLRLGQQHAAGLLVEALRLHEVLTETLAGLAAGSVWVAQAQVLLRGTASCSAEVAGQVERRVLAAGGGRLAPSVLGRRVARAVLAVEAVFEPEASAEREQDARAARRVSTRAEPDGMASLWALLPAEQALGHHAALEELVRMAAQADRLAGVTRTADQRRADVLAGLPARVLAALRSNDPTTGPAGPAGPAAPAASCGLGVEVVVLMPYATVLGWSEEPAELVGYGPISAARARALVPDARLRRALIDDRTGQPLAVEARTHLAGADLGSARTVLRSWLPTDPPGPGPGAGLDLTGLVVVRDDPEPRYTPSAGLGRLVRLRDPWCSGPGCARPARSCDLDHERPYRQGGPTAGSNLDPKSRRCHRAKTISWQVTRHGDGSHTWTSPLGRNYTRPPPWDPPPDLHPARPEPPPVGPSPPWAPDRPDLHTALRTDLDTQPPPPAPPAGRFSDEPPF